MRCIEVIGMLLRLPNEQPSVGAETWHEIKSLSSPEPIDLKNVKPGTCFNLKIARGTCWKAQKLDESDFNLKMVTVVICFIMATIFSQYNGLDTQRNHTP